MARRLLLKFYERGIDLYIWKVLVSLHANLTSYVLFRGHKSGQFNIKRGSRQRGVISPFGFLCFIDDLLHQLTMSNIGLRIGSINVCCPTVADDMCITGTDQNRITNINRYMCPLFSSMEVRIQRLEM